MSILTGFRAFGAVLMLSAAVLTAPVSTAAFADSHGKSMTDGGSAMVGDLMITGAWTRQTPPRARAGGGYLTVMNHGKEADRLMGGKAAFAKRTEIHQMSVVNDVMKMRKLGDGLEVPAGGTVHLKPGGYHVMFLGLTEGLKKDAVVEVTLSFEKAGDVTVKMPVAPVGAKSLAAAAGQAMDHSKMDHGSMDHSGMSGMSAQ